MDTVACAARSLDAYALSLPGTNRSASLLPAPGTRLRQLLERKANEHLRRLRINVSVGGQGSSAHDALPGQVRLDCVCLDIALREVGADWLRSFGRREPTADPGFSEAIKPDGANASSVVASGDDCGETKSKFSSAAPFQVTSERARSTGENVARSKVLPSPLHVFRALQRLAGCASRNDYCTAFSLALRQLRTIPRSGGTNSERAKSAPELSVLWAGLYPATLEDVRTGLKLDPFAVSAARRILLSFEKCFLNRLDPSIQARGKEGLQQPIFWVVALFVASRTGSRTILTVNKEELCDLSSSTEAEFAAVADQFTQFGIGGAQAPEKLEKDNVASAQVELARRAAKAEGIRCAPTYNASQTPTTNAGTSTILPARHCDTVRKRNVKELTTATPESTRLHADQASADACLSFATFIAAAESPNNASNVFSEGEAEHAGTDNARPSKRLRPGPDSSFLVTACVSAIPVRSDVASATSASSDSDGDNGQILYRATRPVHQQKLTRFFNVAK